MIISLLINPVTFPNNYPHQRERTFLSNSFKAIYQTKKTPQLYLKVKSWAMFMAENS